MREEREVDAPEFWVDAEIEGIDLRKGLVNFSPQVYADVLRVWCKHIPDNLEKLRTLAAGLPDAGKLKEYTIAVHGFKGSSYGICADSIGKDAEALESASRSGDLDFIKDSNGAFIAKTELLHARLEKLLGDYAAMTGSSPLAASPDPALLAQFLDACRHYKSSTMEEVLKKLEAYDYELGGDLVRWLREQVDNLEYDAIQERLAAELSAR